MSLRIRFAEEDLVETVLLATMDPKRHDTPAMRTRQQMNHGSGRGQARHPKHPASRARSGARGTLLARPLDTLAFLLPLILFYGLFSISRPRDRVIAFDLLRWFFDLFGPVGVWAPGLTIVAILLATQFASRQPWTLSWHRVGWMYIEAVILAIPLLALNWWIALIASDSASLSTLDKVAMGIGAGVYEELVFRLMLISVVVIIGVDLLRFGRASVAGVAIALSSLAFAAHHHQPIGMEPFDLTTFVFRSLAGVYLAIVFWFRGYGSAAGCHAAYNVFLVGAGLVGS